MKNKKTIILTLVYLLCFINTNLLADVGSWTMFSDDGVRNIDEVAFVRDSSGILYICWPKDEGDTYGVRCRTLSADGKTLSSIVTAVTGWDSINNPGMRILSGGILQLVVSGLGGPGSNNGGSYSYEGGTTGTSWTFNSEQISSSSGVSDIGILNSSSTLITGWAVTGGVFYHEGRGGVEADQHAADQPSCCGYNTNFAADAISGETYLAWNSNATGRYGQWVQMVLPTAASSATMVPNSAREDGLAALDPRQKVAISARQGASGVYLGFCEGYPSCGSVELWRIGDSDSQTVWDDGTPTHVALSDAPDGRLWIAWAAKEKAYVVRSNTNLTRFGRVQSFDLPGDKTIYKLAIQGSMGPVDLMVNVGLSGAEHYHLHTNPALSIRGPRRVRKGGRARFTANDAGDPVQGAKVKAFGRRKTTNAAGKAVFRVPNNYRRRATKAFATKTGYENSNKLKVKVR